VIVCGWPTSAKVTVIAVVNGTGPRPASGPFLPAGSPARRFRTTAQRRNPVCGKQNTMEWSGSPHEDVP
jgi:hypothetical protein